MKNLPTFDNCYHFATRLSLPHVVHKYKYICFFFSAKSCTISCKPKKVNVKTQHEAMKDVFSVKRYV